MYCRNCGKQLSDQAVVCPHCGVQVAPFATEINPPPRQTGTQKSSDTAMVLAIVGFVLSFFISIAGLVCCILAMRRKEELSRVMYGLALAGLVLSIVAIAAEVIALITLIGILSCAPVMLYA